MTRALLILAAIVASLAPPLTAQNPVLCVFQEKQRHHTQDDIAAAMANELTDRTAYAGPAVDFIPISGFPAKAINAEAERRHCSWIVTLWREKSLPETPTFEGDIGAIKAPTSQTVATAVQGPGSQDRDLLEYSMRRAGSHKLVTHGAASDPSRYLPIVDAIVKELRKSK
jgi:hypothetical protein